MDQGTGACTQGQSAPVTDNVVVVKLELPWSMNEELQDESSAVYSTEQPMSDYTSGSLLSLNTSHACQHCSAVFMLSSSLEVHLETFHGKTHHSELPVASRLQNSASDNTNKTPSGQERFSAQLADRSRDDSVTSATDFVIKLEPVWSMEKEPQDEPSAVYSTVQPMCDNTSGSLLSLNTSHVCQRCSATFVLFSSLELHIVTFHGETSHSFFPVYSAYSYSVGYHHGSETENVGNYNSQKTVKGRKETVEDNDADRADLGKKNRKHVCDVCGKAFAEAGNLKKHKRIHTGERPYKCPHCDAGFIQTTHLKTHVRLMHEGDRPHVCDVCGKAFCRIVDLERHKRTHSGERPYICTDCGKGFSCSGNLKIHQLTHTSEKPFVCTDCEKGFNQSGDLKKHQLTHTGEKPHVCPNCGKRYAQSGNLKMHQLTHTGEKPHVCTDCGKGFTSTNNLKKHQMTHTGEKPHACPDCGRGFTQLVNLKKHELTHTGEKPHTCPHCAAGFTQSSHLKAHVQKLHQ